MYSNQQNLPKFPVPPLSQTLTKLRRSLLPFCASEEEQSRISALIEDFGKSPLARTLQARLEQRASQEGRDNWLDSWWFEFAYHRWREPLMVNSNWFMVLKDHSYQPASLLHPKLAVVPKGHFTTFQVRRAAGLINNALNMKEAIENGKIEPETQGKKKTPLCMNQYRMMFGWTRRPLPECDELVNHGGFPNKSRHITLIIRDQIFNMDCYDSAGRRVTVDEVERQIWDAINQVLNLQKKQICIGVLTSDHRDVWAEARGHLVNLGSNRKSLHDIESSLFCVCLDDWSVPDDFDMPFANMAHGFTGRNRWYDKALTIIVMSNGKAGMNGEHSPCDALIPSRLMDWLVESEPVNDPPGCDSNSVLNRPTLIEWKVDDVIREFVQRSCKSAAVTIENCDPTVLIFNQYGSALIKQISRVSPDAYVQMAIQLAYYRLHGKWTSTYETGSTRSFLHGRTECIRSCTVEAVEFVRSFDQPGTDSKTKLELFKNACRVHTGLTLDSLRGQGIDRHLMGLKLSMKHGESHPLFSDPIMGEAVTFRLSTSGLSNGDNYNGTGFGAVAPDGYGMNYCIGNNQIKVGIESKKKDPSTSSKNFKQSLVKSLTDIRAIYEKTESKL